MNARFEVTQVLYANGSPMSDAGQAYSAALGYLAEKKNAVINNDGTVSGVGLEGEHTIEGFNCRITLRSC